MVQWRVPLEEDTRPQSGPGPSGPTMRERLDGFPSRVLGSGLRMPGHFVSKHSGSLRQVSLPRRGYRLFLFGARCVEDLLEPVQLLVQTLMALPKNT